MNKKQIIEHKEVIKWFCDNPNKGVWKTKNIIVNEWELTYNPQFCKDVIYIQNDEYAEFRKALKDGKTVEYSLPTTNQWNVVDNSKQHFSNCFKYRVKPYKPEEPEFKVGDWVRIKHFDEIVQLKKVDTIHRVEIYIQEFNKCFYFKDIELWQPKQNELCIFWINGDDKKYCVIAPYRYYTNSLYYDQLSRRGWDNIAPLEFIETLKEIRNENN